MNDGNRTSRLARGLERALLFMLYAVPLTVTWTVAGVHIAIGCGAGFALLWGIVQRRWPLHRTPADRAWLAWGLVCFASALWAQPEASSWQPMKKVALIPLAHVAAFGLRHGWRGRWALRLLVGATALTALVGSALFLGQEQPPHARLSGWSHYITFAGQILLVLPAAVCAVFMTRGRARLLYATAAVALAVALVLTFTRGAWIGVLVAGAFVLARTRPRWLLVVPVVVVLLVAVAPERYRDRALSSFDPDHPQNVERVIMWRAGLEIWKHHPITGVGLGDLIPVLAEYTDPPLPFGHLHNNFVQVMASRGTLGLLAFVWLQLSFAVLLWRARSRDPETAALLLGLQGSFWGFQFMGLVEWNFGDVEIMIPLYYVLGTAAVFQGSAPTPASERRGGSGTPQPAGLFQEETEQGGPAREP